MQLTDEMVSWTREFDSVGQILVTVHVAAANVVTGVLDFSHLFASAFFLHQINDSRWEALL